MNMKFRFEFFDPEKKKCLTVCYEPVQKFAIQTEAWIAATLRCCEIARENQWILLEIETYFIGEKEVS